MQIDERVYKLYLYLEDHSFNRDDVSEFLGVTARQLSRLLNKWQEEGIIEYISGVGRGNTSEVKFNVNVESGFVNHLVHHIESYDVQQLQEILNYPMSDGSRKLIKICIDESLFVRSAIDYKEIYHIEYLYHIPKSLNPLLQNDIALMNILNNIADRLYYIDGHELKSKLTIYDEWINNDLIIHLYRNTRFSNGDVLHASEVCDCLNQLINSKSDRLPYSEIKSVEYLDSNKIKIKMNRRMESIKWALAKAEASIYKVVDDAYIFTGAYKVDNMQDDFMKLTFNKYSLNDRPDITTLFFVTDIMEYKKYYSEIAFKEFCSSKYYSNDFVLFNPKTKLSNIQRSEIIDVFKGIFHQDRKVSKIQLDTSCKLLLLAESSAVKNNIADELTSKIDGLQVITADFSSYMLRDLNTFDVDMVLMGEVVSNSYFYFELLTTGKFIDWYGEYKQSNDLLYIYYYKTSDYWKYAEKHYESYMKNNNFIVILRRSKKLFYLPDNFHNVTTDSYGNTFYNEIVVVDEAYNND